MTQLFGIRVQRTGKVARASSHIVWSGMTEPAREEHKEFIRTWVHDPEYDGELSFENVESEVLVDRLGHHRLADGRLVDICSIRGITAFGYILKLRKRGGLKHSTLFHCYVNGQGRGCSAGLQLVS